MSTNLKLETVEEIIEWQHSYAESAKAMIRLTVGWKLDQLRVWAGQAVPLDDWDENTEGRLMFCRCPAAEYNHFHKVVDV